MKILLKVPSRHYIFETGFQKNNIELSALQFSHNRIEAAGWKHTARLQKSDLNGVKCD